MSGIAEQRDAAAHQAAERFDIMDFNAVGSLRVEGGDQLLHRRRPAGKVAAEVSAQGVTILRQTRRQRHIKEKVEPAGGDRHQRDALAFADKGGPLIAGRQRFIYLHQTVPVDVAGVAPLRVKPSTHGRSAEWLPSAAISRSPLALLPSVNHTVTPSASSSQRVTRLPNCTLSRPQ